MKALLILSLCMTPSLSFFLLRGLTNSDVSKPYQSIQSSKIPSYGGTLDQHSLLFKPTVEKPYSYDNVGKPSEKPQSTFEISPYQQSSIHSSGVTHIPTSTSYQTPNINPLTHIFQAGNQYFQKLASIFENPRLVKELLVRNQAIAHSIDRTAQENNQLVKLIEKMNLIQCPPGAKRYHGKCLQLFEVLADTYFNAEDICRKKGGELPSSTLENVEDVFKALDVHHDSVVMSVFWAIKPCENQASYAPTSLCSSYDDKEVKIDPKIKIRRDPHGSRSSCMRLAVSYGEYSLASVPCTGDYHGTTGSACVACEFTTTHLIHK